MIPAYIIIIISIPLLMFGNMGNLTFISLTAFLLSFGSCWGVGAFYPTLPEIFHGDTVPTVTGIAGGIGDIGMPVAPLLIGVFFGIRGMWDKGWGVCLLIAVISMVSILTLIIKIRKA
jgi:nitrate/nitrite transporter NarK